MARIYLDANVVIDLAEERRGKTLGQFGGHNLFISPISLHILAYTYKYEIPDKKLTDSQKYFTIIPFDALITIKSFTGPTKDFEDNVQLHSAAAAECDFFLTEDKKLLSMKFFGKTQIIPQL